MIHGGIRRRSSRRRSIKAGAKPRGKAALRGTKIKESTHKTHHKTGLRSPGHTGPKRSALPRRRVSSRPLTELPPTSQANANMAMTVLQKIAKRRGIPFGGLTKERLVHKIRHY